MFDNLHNGNFNDFAQRNYVNPCVIDTSEFQEDLKRIMYIKRLFKKYKHDGELRDWQLVLNHIIVIYNNFETNAASRMLFLKLEEYLDCLKPFLMWLSYWDDPRKLGTIGGKTFNNDIDTDTNIALALKGL